jgi:hypothetical protein
MEPRADPADEQRCEALMAGTLCLMSCFADRPRPEFGRKVADNLRMLARRGDYSAELRTILERLASRWDRLASGIPPDGALERQHAASVH